MKRLKTNNSLLLTVTLPELAEYGPKTRQALYDVEGIGFGLKQQELKDVVFGIGEVRPLDPENHKVD